MITLPFKSILQKVNSVVETKKANLLQKLEVGSPWLIFVNWVLTNWITILIVGTVAFFGLRNYIQLQELQATLLNKEIQTLNKDLKEAKEEREKLLLRLKDFEKASEAVKADVEKVRKNVTKLGSLQKKTKLLDYKNRLMRVRGYK